MKVFIALILATVSINGITQTPVNSNDYIPSPGDQFINICCSEFSNPIDTGLFITWNFLNAFSSCDTDITTYEIIDSNLVNIGGVGELNDVQLRHSIFERTECLDINNSSVRLLAYETGSNYIIGSSELVFAEFPITYGQNLINNFYYVPTFEPWLREGLSDLRVNGYGTLILPSGTFDDVYKIQIINDGDHVWTNVSPNVHEPHIDTMNVWVKAGVHHPLLITHTDNWLHTVSVNKAQYLSSYSHASINTIENTLEVMIYPNPVSAQLFILTYSLSGFSYKIHSHSGKLIQEGVSSKQMHELDIKTLSTGVYIISIELGENVVKKKVIIE